jgi:DNA-binding transcriptional LysR family regulator
MMAAETEYRMATFSSPTSSASASSLNRVISLRHLRCFLEVARTGSFTAAAARSFITQSALTSTIQQFEETIGLKLFERTTRRVVLTREGESFRPEAERVLRQFESAIDDLGALAEGQKGQIRIVAAASVIYSFLAEAMREFRAAYPEVNFVVRDTGAEVVERMVADGDTDFAIISKHKGNEALQYQPLLRDEYGIICNKRHPLAAGTAPVDWADLPQPGFLRFAEDTGVGTYLKREVGHLPVMALARDEVSSTTTLFALLRDAEHYSVIPALAASMGGPDLVFRPVRAPVLSRETCLITRRLRSLSPGTARLLEIVRRIIRNKPLPPGVTALEP